MKCCNAGERFQVRKGNFVQCQACGETERFKDLANERLRAIGEIELKDEREPSEIRKALANGMRRAPWVRT
jgi:hypothetical protein